MQNNKTNDKNNDYILKSNLHIKEREKQRIKEERKVNTEQLKLIPKIEDYVQYILELIYKLPRIERFNIGNEYKKSMYETLEYALYITKPILDEKLKILNKIDVTLNCQRIFLRIMLKNRWIDERKFKIAMEKISELGKMTGGLMKYYAKNT